MIGPSYYRSRAHIDAVKLRLRPALLSRPGVRVRPAGWASMADAEERGDLAAMASLREDITVFEGAAVDQ